MFRRSFAAVATSREGHRSPRSDPAVLHRRWGQANRFPQGSPISGHTPNVKVPLLAVGVTRSEVAAGAQKSVA